MRKRGVPREYTEWMERWLGNCRTTLTFDDYEMEAFIVENGLDQGDPYSGVCYLIYNSDLLEIPIIRIGEWILLFVDDAVIIVTGKDFTETHKKLQDIMNQAGGIFEWARDHNCKFGIEKFQLLDISRKLIPHQLNPKKKIPVPRHALILGDQHIPSK
jgi:Reverse transcriptase (RNA-dependent DNA polymerase)